MACDASPLVSNDIHAWPWLLVAARKQGSPPPKLLEKKLPDLPTILSESKRLVDDGDWKTLFIRRLVQDMV